MVPHGFSERPSGLLVPDRIQPAQPIGVDLFSGCGGFSLGMHAGGFDVRVAAEFWDAAATTYLANLGHPECRIHVQEGLAARWPKESGWIGGSRRREPDAEDDEWNRTGQGCRDFFLWDISQLLGEQIAACLDGAEIAVVFGGPPCQGLSVASGKACIQDPRNAMLWHFLRLVAELQPLTFVMENVPPLLTAAKGALFEALCAKANAAGYDVVANVIDAVNHGVPQYRRRAIVMGSRTGKAPTLPMPTSWCHGRNRNGESWSQEDETAKRSGLRFDETTKRWAESPEEPTAAGEQLDLFAGEVARG